MNFLEKLSHYIRICWRKTRLKPAKRVKTSSLRCAGTKPRRYRENPEPSQFKQGTIIESKKFSPTQDSMEIFLWILRTSGGSWVREQSCRNIPKSSPDDEKARKFRINLADKSAIIKLPFFETKPLI